MAPVPRPRPTTANDPVVPSHPFLDWSTSQTCLRNASSAWNGMQCTASEWQWKLYALRLYWNELLSSSRRQRSFLCVLCRINQEGTLYTLIPHFFRSLNHQFVASFLFFLLFSFVLFEQCKQTRDPQSKKALYNAPVWLTERFSHSLILVSLLFYFIFPFHSFWFYFSFSYFTTLSLLHSTFWIRFSVGLLLISLEFYAYVILP